MTLIRRLTLLLVPFIVFLGAPLTARAARFDRLGFHLQSSALFVHENAGRAVITVERTDVSRQAGVRYITQGFGVHCGSLPCSAVSPYDFKYVHGIVRFAPGVASVSFSIPIVDHHAFTLPATLHVALFGPSPIGMASPSDAVLTILNDDRPPVLDVSNPLGLAARSRGGNPLAGARFFVDRQMTVDDYVHRYPVLERIASQPHTERFGGWDHGNVGGDVTRFLARVSVQGPHTVPLLSTYYLAGPCVADSPARQRAYHNFITLFARGIGSYRAVLFLEMDGLITTGCLSPHALAVRIHEIRDAIGVLKAHCPRLVIYLDAGAADAVSVPLNASLLRRAGVAKIQGFFLNSTHFDWTRNEIRYGDAISRLIGGKHFVVNTAVNGRGPLVPANVSRDGMEVLCNPPGRGLGPKPTSHTGFRNVDAFAWIGNPGNSGGQCGGGAPATGAWWLALAIQLARDADFRVR